MSKEYDIVNMAIVITEHFCHPQFGGHEQTHHEYRDFNKAQHDYSKMKHGADKSGGLYWVEINVKLKP